MDKVKLMGKSMDEGYNSSLIITLWSKQCEIIDWINAEEENRRKVLENLNKEVLD